jgi:large subunit ribosomal protein L7/L12
MNDKVQKILDLVSELTLVEASELVKAMEEKFGVTAAAPMMMGGSMPMQGGAGAAGGEAAEEKTEFTVVLKSFGDKKIDVIKAVRAIKPELGLIDAKNIVEGAPANIVENVNKEEADKAAKTLKEAGADVEVK